MESWHARSTISLRFWPETECATSAAYVLLCIMSISSSFTLCTRNLKKPQGSMYFVLLSEPVVFKQDKTQVLSSAHAPLSFRELVLLWRGQSFVALLYRQ